MNRSNIPTEKTVLEPAISKDLFDALTAIPVAMTIWQDITPIARRDWVSWIDSAKQEVTRKIRIEKACSKLASGKRRPCCYALVPMKMYRALDANPGAKHQWKKLTPDKRRDLIGWIDSVEHPETSQSRIEEACAILASGTELYINT